MSEQANPHLITALNLNYLLYSEPMSVAKVKEEFSFTTNEAYEELAKCRSALENRGFTWPDEYNKPEIKAVKEKPAQKRPKSKELDFDPFFVLACHQILTLGDKRTPAAKLKEIGLTVSKWENYLLDPKYWNFYEKMLKERFDRVEQEAQLSLARNVASGDLQSIKYFNEWTGKYRPQSDVQFNLGLVIGRLMEALSKFLTPDQLIEVADVIEVSINEQKELTA